jgi:N-acetylmuramoyl-L-alanine amidase
MIHEFIADQKALDDNDITAFSEMILQTVYPGQNFSLTNNFFYSPLKRRLIMLTKNKNPKVSYVSRLLVLPLAAIVFFAFTLKVKKASDGIVYKNKMINVVIDAGHGGSDNGAVSPDGLKEKDIVLSIAEKIKALNTNPNVQILLSRNHDELIPLKDRVEFAKENGADMFISIHLDAAEKEEPSNGFSVIIDRSNNNQLLASALIGELKKSYKTEDNIKGRNGNIFVLDKNPLPAALIECGYITDAGDKAFITNNSNQEKIAKNILDAINIYASADKTSSVAPVVIASGPGNDTIGEMYYKGKKVTGLSLSSSRNTVKVKYADGSKETITKEEAEKRGFRLPPPPPAPVPPVAPNAAVPPVPPVPAAPAAAPAPPVPPLPKDAVYVVGGKEVSVATARSIDPDKIQSINVLKDGAAVKKYGEKGRNGVIEIQLKDNNDGIQITAVHNQIPGESLYIVDGKERPSSEVKSIPPAHIESINVLKGESAVKKYGDKGKNGVIEITLKSDAASQFLPGTDKVFTQTETPATFPGGPAAWSKFIMGKIQANIDSLSDKDYGTCVLKFLVKKDGKISDVKATTMQGTRLAEVAVNAVKNGPDWNPAEQNGHKVNSFRLQPVTLKKSN